MYIVVFIRDFPELPIGWRSSYCVNYNKHINYGLVIVNKLNTIKEHGGKYGAIVYKDGQEHKKFNQKGEEI